MLALMLIAIGVLFWLGYHFYGGWLEKQLDVMEERITPAHALKDGVDYMPTPTPIVFGHHFSSIAGAGPIVGPISAALVFGWGPALLWIAIGAVFIGGVQDFSSLVASLRHRGEGLAQIGRRRMSPLTYRLFLLFLILTLDYILIVFLDMTAATFAPVTVEWGMKNPPEALTGGTVATASLSIIAIAVAFGQILHRGKMGLKGATLVMVPLVFLALALGQWLPLAPSVVPACYGLDNLAKVQKAEADLENTQNKLERDSVVYDQVYPSIIDSTQNNEQKAELYDDLDNQAAAEVVEEAAKVAEEAAPEAKDKYFWSIVLLAYCLAASVLPVWTLLQPRDYLSSFLLYACLAAGVVGMLCSGFTGTGTISWPAFKTFSTPTEGTLWPALLVTIACGAVSGFHALVSSGTTSKQLDNERAARTVGMGAMLVEGVLAVMALATVMTMAPDAKAAGAPPAVFAAGIEAFFRPMGVPQGWIESFVLLAVSTFLLTTLDSCTRLARMLFQEMTGMPNRTTGQRVAATAVLLLPVLLAYRQVQTPNGLIPMWKAIWPAFGATNQLLAALALLMVWSWLRSQGKKAWFVAIPMVFMAITSMAALVQLVGIYGKQGNWEIASLSILLLGLAVLVLADVVRHIRRGPPTGYPA